MSKKIRLGYDILSKRAIETESGVNIDEALKKITSYKKVPGTGDDNHPDVARPSTKVFYIVKVAGAGQPDAYKEWIWNQPEDGLGSWECVGDTTDEKSSWKRWSESHGSAGGDQSVYIGQRNSADTSDPTYNIGNDNIVTGTNSDADVPLAMNLGAKNTINGEGLNLGKHNISERFGVTLGQGNHANHGSIAVGNKMRASYGSIAIGNGDMLPDGAQILLSMMVDGKAYPTEKIKANVWPIYPKATVVRLSDEKYHWVEVIPWPNNVYWQCIVNNELGQYLVTRNGWSTSGRYTGYFDDNSNFIASSDPAHNIHTYAKVTSAYTANGGRVSTSFYASLDEHNDVIATNTMVRFVGGYSGEIPDGGSILTQNEYDEITAGLADSSFVYSDVSVNPEDDTDGIRQVARNTDFFDTVDVYGYDSESGFIPYSILNKDDPHEFYWKTVSFDEIVNSTYTAADFFPPSGDSKLSATYNSIAIGKSQEVSASSIGISPSVPDSMHFTNDRYSYISFPVYNQAFTQYSIDQATGTISASQVTKRYIQNANYYTGGTYDFSGYLVLDPANCNYVSGGSVGIFDKSDSNSSSVSAGSLGIGAGLNSTGNSVAIGHHGINATGGSLAAGFATADATGGSIAIGNSTVTAMNGSFIFGNNGSTARNGSFVIGSNGSYADNGSVSVGHSNQAYNGSTVVGASSYASDGAFTFGRGMTAYSAGISIGTTGGNQSAKGRSAQGEIVKYKNPDNIYVPIRGAIRVKSGYSIDHVRVFRNVSYDGTTYDYAVLGIDSGYYGSNSTVYLYKNGTEVTSVYGTDIRNAFNTSSEEYWRIKNGSVYSFVPFVAEKTYNELSNLKNLKEYLEINPQTFTKDEQVYVYADGFNYPTTGLTTNNWIPISSCTFDVYDYWTGVMLGYGADGWNRLTASGGYNKGIAIGANAHAEGCSFAIAPNYDVMGSSSTVSIGNRLYASSNGLPTSLLYDIYYNGNSISANGYSAAIGLESITATGHSFALGNQSLRAYGHSTAIGTDGVYADGYSLSIGCKTNDAYNYSFAIGQNSNFATGYSFAIGTNSNTASGYSLAIGTNSNQARDYSLAIGDGNNAETYSSVFGYNSKAYHGSIVLGKYALAFDYSTSIGVNTGAYNYSTAIGDGIGAYDYSFGVGRRGTVKNYSVSVGESNYVEHYALAMGRWNNSDNRSVAIGDNNQASQYAVSMGRENNARGENVAIGIRNSVNNDSYSGSHGIAIGEGNTSKEGDYNISFGLNNAASQEAVSIGTSNDVHGWSIAIGQYNTSYDGPGGHVTMIGQFNTSTSNQEVIHKEFQGDFIPGVPYEPTEIELSQVSQYRTAVHNALATGLTSSELAIFDSYYSQYEDWGLGRTDNYPSASQEMIDISNHFKTMPPYSLTTEEQYNIFESNSYSLSNLLRQIRRKIDTSSEGHYEIIDEDVVCNSFLAGNNNKSNHYNSILIGALNESQTPQVQPDATYHTTDDDGFMIAIGYRNVVGRNYDIAIGYGSKAIGGENVAIQHSTAGDGNNSYHNLAMFDSTALGTGNIALQNSTTDGYRNLVAFDSSIEGTGNISIMESNANITLSKSAKAVTSSVLHNMLLNTKVNVEGNNWYDESDGTHMLIKNIMANCKLDGNVSDEQESKACGLYAYSVGYNIMSNLYRGRIDSYSIWDNVLLGNDTADYRTYDYEYARYDVNNTESFSRNFIFRPRGGRQNDSTGETFNGGIRITDTLAFDENVVLLSSVDIPKPTGDVGYYKDRYVSNNFLMHSRLIGNPKAVVDNVLFGDSILSADYVRTNTGTTAISNNFLLNSRLTATAEGHRTDNKRGVLNTNFLIGTDAVDVVATFSFNDRGGKVDPPKYFLLHRTFRCANFGDNDMSFANDTFVQGSYNSIACLAHSSIFGNRNKVSGTDDYIQYCEENDWISRGINALHVMGDDNYVFYKRPGNASYWDYLSRTCIVGAYNTVIGDGLGANTIIGDNNDIDDYYPLLTENELVAKQNQLATTSYCSMSENAVDYSLSNGQKTPITTNSQISVNSFVSGDRIASEYSSAATEIQWSEFASRYNNGTLAKGYYKITGTINVNLLTTTLYKGTYRPYHTIITMKDGVVTTHSDYAQNRSDAHGTTKNILIGSHNRVRSQIHAYALIGSDNDVLNTHTDVEEYQRYNTEYGIGNGFLQGNNNYAEDGSNIILMGNGNSGYGHNAVAIGCQLISNQWQTVIGKYNQPVDGPDRLTSADDPSQSNKALFIVGNGYSTKDDRDWKDEQFITRSNAMVVYANGDTVFGGNVNAANLPPAPSNDGRYALNCIVTNGVPSYSWVPVGTVTV